MMHLDAEPASECAGHLLYLGRSDERVYNWKESRWVEVIRSCYQCEGCDEYINLDRRVLFEWEGVKLDTHVGELRFEVA